MIIEPLEKIYSITELNSKARALLELELGTVWVMGELSNLATPSSGHWYFTLKDKEAQVRCAFFRSTYRLKIPFKPENGQQIIAKANVSLYETRGDYQLIITELQLAGSGALQVAFEQLKQKLQQEGLFDLARKKPIPTFPRTIGVITSPSGAVIHDILNVLHRRNPTITVIIYPSAVQGAEAKTQLVAAIKLANQRCECDVLILARGGGSLEDLWPFNEEIVARAIAASQLPIVTGVGHEVDVTIADFVADYRAPTPSAAAEYISVDQQDIQQKFTFLNTQLQRHMQYILQCYYHQLSQLKIRLRHPGDHLREQAQRLDYLEQQLLFAMKNHVARSQAKLVMLRNTVQQLNPLRQIERYQHQLKQGMMSLHYKMMAVLNQKQETFASLAQQLDTLSPLATLKRGYAVVTNPQGQLITSIHLVNPNEPLTIRLNDGVIECVTT